MSRHTGLPRSPLAGRRLFEKVVKEPSVNKPENRGPINLFNIESERKQTWWWYWWSGGTECTLPKVAKLYPLVLLVKEVCRQGKDLGSKEGRVMGHGLLKYAVEEKNSSI